MGRFMRFKFLVIFSFFLITVNVFSEDTTGDTYKKKNLSIIDPEYIPPKEKLKKPQVLFNFGGNIFFKSKILLKSDGTNTYFKQTDTGFDIVASDKWFFNTEGRFYGRIAFSDDNYFHFGLIGLFNLMNYNLTPLFNVDEFYLHWKYPLGKIIIGRTHYSLKSETIFNGLLDAIQLTINIPFLNFKTFVGYSGFLGLFNPYFNPYAISNYDNSFISQTNLINSKIAVQINGNQSRRIFFATDFDIYLFAQHLNPYFLMQMDLSSIFGNKEYLINTFHLGANFEGKIVQNLFYTFNFSGMFGTNQNVITKELKSISSFALQTNLRYSINSDAVSTFILGYSVGYGTNDPNDFYSDTLGTKSESINKFYYYGKFDGGFVLNPILSNIQVLSLKYVLTPKIKSNLLKISFYTSFYQTFKIYPEGSISDSEAGFGNIVGSEFDMGLLINAGKYVSIGFDYGLFIPEEVYQVKTPRMRGGANISITF